MLAAFPAGFRPMVAQPPMLWAQPLPISVWVVTISNSQPGSLRWHCCNITISAGTLTTQSHHRWQNLSLSWSQSQLKPLPIKQTGGILWQKKGKWGQEGRHPCRESGNSAGSSELRRRRIQARNGRGAHPSPTVSNSSRTPNGSGKRCLQPGFQWCLALCRW